MKWPWSKPSPPPWAGAPDLDAQLAAIEAIAERNGFAGKRKPEMTRDQVNDIEIACRQPLPPDLRKLMEWYDSTLWSWFVNPHQRRLSDRKCYARSGGIITPGHPEDRLDDPFTLGATHVAIERVATSKERHLASVRDKILIERTRDARWLDATFFVFGWSHRFEEYLYTVNSPTWSSGSIVLGMDDDCHMHWVSESLAAFLARLIACEGWDYALGIDNYRKPTHLEAAFIREWKQQNPNCTWWG